MAGKDTLRVRYLKLLEILNRETDENHPMSSVVLLDRLKEYGINIERKTLYADIKTLNNCGYEVLCDRTKTNNYYVLDRQFDVPELKILTDAVLAASFIPEQKTKELKTKIAALAGSHRKKVLLGNQVCFDTNKHSNNQIYFSVNEIHEAIIANKQISFKYFDLNCDGVKEYRKDGQRYEVNPLATVFSNDNYYLTCYSDKYGTPSNYRIDRMEEVSALEDSRTPCALLSSFDINRYRKKIFGMFLGDEASVHLLFDKSLIDVIYDKFGEKTRITRVNDRFSAVVRVIVSPQFYGFILGLGEKIQIIEPKEVVSGLTDLLKGVSKLYDSEG